MGADGILSTPLDTVSGSDGVGHGVGHPQILTHDLLGFEKCPGYSRMDVTQRNHGRGRYLKSTVQGWLPSRPSVVAIAIAGLKESRESSWCRGDFLLQSLCSGVIDEGPVQQSVVAHDHDAASLVLQPDGSESQFHDPTLHPPYFDAVGQP